MKNSVYALIAVVVGVILMGMLPSQLSHIAAPMLTNLQDTSKEATGNLTLSGQTPLRQNDTTQPNTGTTTPTSTANTSTKIDLTERMFTLGEASENPYSDMMYYSLLGIGLLVAISVYFIAKRAL